MSVSVESRSPGISLPIDGRISDRARSWLSIALAAGLAAALLTLVVRPVDARTLAAAQQAPILPGD